MTLDLEVFILILKKELNKVRVLLIVVQFLVLALENRVRSSFKNRWEILGPEGLMEIGS